MMPIALPALRKSVNRTIVGLKGGYQQERDSGETPFSVCLLFQVSEDGKDKISIQHFMLSLVVVVQ